MRKIVQLLLCLVLFTYAEVGLLQAQNTISYNDTFITNVSYGSGNSQWNNWSSFRASLDTSTHCFLKVTMKGTYDVSGHVCADPKLVKQIAYMLKNNTSNSVTCNGNTWKAGTVGDGVEFSSDGTLNKCAKKGGYTLRPQMGSSRWGGINTGSCGNVSQRMMVVFEKVSKPQDIGVSAIKVSFCSPVVSVAFNNFGNTPVDSLKIGWSVNKEYQNQICYPKKMNGLTEVNLNLTPQYDFKDGEFYTIKAWTIHPNKQDSVSINDTSLITYKYIAPPALPKPLDNSRCGIGKSMLEVIPVSSNDSIVWYDSKFGGNQLGKGKTFVSPTLNTGTTVFYAEVYRLMTNGSRCTNQERAEVKAVVKPRPSGAEFGKSSNFITTQPFTSGTQSNPDIVAANDVLTYELYPPKGFQNKDYNITWDALPPQFITNSGKVLSNSYFSFTPPTSFVNGTIVFKADSVLTSSFINLTMNIRDLRPNSCDSIITRSIFIAPRPVVDFKFSQSICNGDTVRFINQSKITSGNMVYHWDFGTSNLADTSNFTDASFTFPTHGTYQVKLTATSVPYGYSNTLLVPVQVNEKPKAGFAVLSACIGDSVSFINTTTLSQGSPEYTWNLGDKTFNTSKDIKHSYANVGSYDVTLKASSNGCSSSLTKKAHQFIRPVANFSVTGNCIQSLIQFTNLTKIEGNDNFGSHWEFGDTKQNNELNPEHSYETSGDKIVKYMATSQFGCKDSMVKTISVLASPEASFSTGPVCNRKPVLFHNSTTEPDGVIANYIWDFGDGNISESINPSHLYPEIGSYTVKLKALGNNGCSTLIAKNIKVLEQPTANFEALDACAGEDVIFTNKTKGIGTITYHWDFGDGENGTEFNPVKKYNTTKAYKFKVTLNAKNEVGCEDEITLPVIINEKPSCKFSYKSTETGGLEYSFTPENSSYSSYQWSFEGGGNSNLTNPSHKFETNGKYRVRVMMTNAAGCGCMDSSQFITINSLGYKTFEAKSGISFFPNPNNGSFTIVSSGGEINVSISDLNGKVLITEKLSGNTNYNVHYDQLASGMYMIEIAKPNGERTSGKLNVIK